jgi:hypothetical protein
VTLAPGIVFILLKIIFSGGAALLADHPWLPFSVVLYSLFLAGLFSLAALATSALSRNRRFAGILLFVIYFGSDVAYAVGHQIFRAPQLGWLSIRANLQQVGAVLFGAAPPLDAPWAVSALILAGLAGLAVFFLFKRIRGVEVIR